MANESTCHMTNEKRLVCLDNIIEQLEHEWGYEGMREDLYNLPTVDAVEVRRCKDCKYYEIHRPKVLENCERNGHLIPMKPDDFCSYGERREGE